MLFTAVFGYTQKYNFTNYSVEDGLAQSQINDISQDQYGYLWIGTESGLSQFNGLDFVNYSMGDGLPDNKVEKIYFEPDGTMWIATPKGLALFEDDKFVPYDFPEPLRVNDLEIYNDKLYIATNVGLYWLDGDTYYEVPFSDSTDLYIRALQVVESGEMICGSRTGIYTFDGTSYEVFEDSSFLSFNISDLDLVDGSLIISTFGDGLFNYNLKSKKLFDYNLEFSRIRSIYANEQVILCSTISGGVEISGNEITYFTEANGLANDRLICTFVDHENNYWLGTDGNGLLKFLGKSVTSFSVDDGLSSNIVMSISQDLDSSFVFGTYREGLTKINFNNGETFYKTQDKGLKDNSVWVTTVDSLGRCWIGTSDGVNCLQDGEFIDHPISDKIDTKIRSIITEKNNFFFGGTNGLYIYDGNELKTLPNTDFMNINHLSYGKGKIYIGSRNGLYSLSDADNFQKVDSIQLPENNINSVLFDSRDNLWIGTENGLFVRMKSSQIIPFDLERTDFKSKTILGLIESKDHSIWVSTMSGVYRIKGKGPNQPFEYTVLHYGSAEGLVNLETNQNSLFEDYDGNIWVGTSKALARIDPSLDSVLFDFKPPVLHFTGIRLFMEEFDYNRFKVEYTDHLQVPSYIKLPHDQNHLTFDFIGINLKDPESVMYEYRLSGSHGGWSPLTQSTYATYSDISAGNYTFEVRATNKRFQWSKIKSITLIIRPPFWQTWWFLSLAVILAFFLVFLIFQIRIRAIKQKQENEKLGYKNRLLFLEQQSLNASMNRHFIFNSLNSIQYFINSSDKLSANKYLSSFAKLIRKNLDSSTTNNFIVTLQEEIERIELYLSLEKMRFQDKFDYKINVSSELDTESTEIPSMILQPFVENSIIHGVLPVSDRMGQIKIDIYRELDDVVFEVFDDGIGIDNTLSRKKEAMGGDHQSKGMEITNRRIELLRKLTGENLMIIGPYQINDEEGNSLGTKVIIKMGLQIEDEEN